MHRGRAELTGADVPVCVASRACVMTGVGDTLLPLTCRKCRACWSIPRVPVATRDVFKALGLRNGELRVGVTDVLLQATAGPTTGPRSKNGSKRSPPAPTISKRRRLRIEPVIGEVIAALNATNGAWLARMSGSGATCFAIYENTAEAGRAAEKLRRDHPGWWVHAGTLS